MQKMYRHIKFLIWICFIDHRLGFRLTARLERKNDIINDVILHVGILLTLNDEIFQVGFCLPKACLSINKSRLIDAEDACTDII